MFRRETIIALRARHQAHRIVSDILHPHLDLPSPAAPPIPTPDLSPLYILPSTRFRRPITKQQIIVVILLWLIAIIRLVKLYYAGGR